MLFAFKQTKQFGFGRTGRRLSGRGTHYSGPNGFLEYRIDGLHEKAPFFYMVCRKKTPCSEKKGKAYTFAQTAKDTVGGENMMPEKRPAGGSDLRLEPEKRLCPKFDAKSIARYPVAARDEMGMRVVDNCAEEHIM